MSSRSLRYVCSDCRLALRSASVHGGISMTRSTTRSYTSTPSQLKALATFTPTDRPVLDQLFATWRSDVFLPSVVSPHHQKLIYKQSRKDLLTTDPGVSVTVETIQPPSVQSADKQNEEVVRLWPKSAFHMPSTSDDLKTIAQELKESGSGKTWENIIPFLHGCQSARRKIPWSFREKLVNIANEKNDGRWNTMVQAATYAKSTGVTLAEMPFTTALIIGLHDRAAQSNYSLDEASRKLLTQIIVLLEDEEHCGSDQWKTFGPLYQDMRSSIVVVATQLAFSASKALQETANKGPVIAKVSRDVKKLLAILEQTNGTLSEEVKAELVPSLASEFAKNMIAIREYDIRVTLLAALILAKKLDLSEPLGKAANVETKLAISKAIDQVKSKLDPIQQSFESSTKPPKRSLAFRKHVENAISKL